MKAESRLPPGYRRVVVDTNVIISAALSARGATALILRLLLREGQLVFSAATFNELETRLWLPKFDPYLDLEDRQALLRDLAATAHWCESAAIEGTWCRDVTDDKFVALAIAAGVTRIVTGDADLLVLDPLGTLRVVTPAAAMEEIQAVL